ncbi:hypothetical protein TNCV_693151 [Trichonephila clavipes]|nr:hypothetical protein TNCV_693151 [Trichonephila clavipes]
MQFKSSRLKLADHLIQWLVKLSNVPLGMGSREDMNVCNCIVHLWNGGTLNSRRAASPLKRLVAGEERWEVSPGCSHSKLWCLCSLNMMQYN